MVKSRAAQKFLANHPVQHQAIANIIKSEKPTRSKFQWQSEEDQISDELSNMMRNQKIVRLREEDLTSELPRKRQNLHKKLTWSENLVEVHNITDNQSEEILTAGICVETVPDILKECSKKSDIILPNLLPPSLKKNCHGAKLVLRQQNISTPDNCDSGLPIILPLQHIPETKSSLERTDELLGTGKQEENSLKFSFLINCDNKQKYL